MTPSCPSYDAVSCSGAILIKQDGVEYEIRDDVPLSYLKGLGVLSDASIDQIKVARIENLNRILLVKN